VTIIKSINDLVNNSLFIEQDIHIHVGSNGGVSSGKKPKPKPKPKQDPNQQQQDPNQQQPQTPEQQQQQQEQQQQQINDMVIQAMKNDPNFKNSNNQERKEIFVKQYMHQFGVRPSIQIVDSILEK